MKQLTKRQKFKKWKNCERKYKIEKIERNENKYFVYISFIISYKKNEKKRRQN